VKGQLQAPGRSHPAVVATVLATVLLTAGCSSPDAGSARPATPARLQIIEPGPNARSGPDVEVSMRLDHARLVTPIEGLDVRPDRGHVHLSVDGRLMAMPTALRVTLPALDEGAHTITAEFVASDHLPFRNRVVAAVSFRVG
jgi:hypothetical protein